MLDTLVVNATEGPVISPQPSKKPVDQLPLFNNSSVHPVIQSMKALSLDSMTPLEAFDQLRRLITQIHETE